MTQPEIMKLLHEAAAPECTEHRRSEIEAELANAACPEGYPTSTFAVMVGSARMGATQYRGYDVSSLFRTLAATRPDLLPKQAAFFLFACRENNREPIDWSLIP